MPGEMVIQQRPSLETERLLLRPLRKGDERFLAMLDTDPAVMRFIHQGVRERRLAERAALLEVEIEANSNRRIGKWIVELREQPTRIGWVEAFRFKVDGITAYGVGYEFAPAFWGQGYATEAVSVLVSHLINEFNGASVMAYVRPDNEKSHRVLEKVGFRLTEKFVLDEGEHSCNLYTMSPQMLAGSRRLAVKSRNGE